MLFVYLSRLCLCLCACMDVNQGGINRNLCTQGLVFLHAQWWTWLHIKKLPVGHSGLYFIRANIVRRKKWREYRHFLDSWASQPLVVLFDVYFALDMCIMTIIWSIFTFYILHYIYILHFTFLHFYHITTVRAVLLHVLLSSDIEHLSLF